MIYAVWMLHIVGFSDQWWGLLAIWTGHYHGIKFSTFGMKRVRVFTSQAASKSWSELCLRHHWNVVAQYFGKITWACFAHRPFFVNRNVTMRDRFKCFDAMVPPVACFGAARRKVYKQDLCKMDIVFRRLLRSIVGPPGDVDWTLPWHEILHHWNERVKSFTARHGLKTWSVVCLGQYWKFAKYVATLPRERFVVRALNWFPEHARRVGRPAYSWDSMIESFCRHKQIGNWRHCAHDTAFWMNQLDDFVSFTEI